MGSKIGVPVAVGGAVVAVLVVLGGIFVFADTEEEVGPGSGPAPTTRLSLSNPDPSGPGPTPDDPYVPVPDEQVDGLLTTAARTAGRMLYIPVQDNDCLREQPWPRGEHADRVEVEIRPVPTTPPPGMTTDTGGNGTYGCVAWADNDGLYAVIELAEPLGERRLVVKQVFEAPPS